MTISLPENIIDKQRQVLRFDAVFIGADLQTNKNGVLTAKKAKFGRPNFVQYNVINSAIRCNFRPVKAKSAVKSAVKHTKRTPIPTNQRPFLAWKLVDSRAAG